MMGIQQVLHRMMEADSPADAELVMGASHRAPSTYPFPVEQPSATWRDACRHELRGRARMLLACDHPFGYELGRRAASRDDCKLIADD